MISYLRPNNFSTRIQTDLLWWHKVTELSSVHTDLKTPIVISSVQIQGKVWHARSATNHATKRDWLTHWLITDGNKASKGNEKSKQHLFKCCCVSMLQKRLMQKWLSCDCSHANWTDDTLTAKLTVRLLIITKKNMNTWELICKIISIVHSLNFIFKLKVPSTSSLHHCGFNTPVYCLALRWSSLVVEGAEGGGEAWLHAFTWRRWRRVFFFFVLLLLKFSSVIVFFFFFFQECYCWICHLSLAVVCW